MLTGTLSAGCSRRRSRPAHDRFGAVAGSWGRVLLALAAELREVDTELALRRLDDLASDLAERRSDVARLDVQACRDVLTTAAGFRARPARRPEDLMLDIVIEEAEGDPLVVAVVYAEVAQRAGIPLEPVRCGGSVCLAHGDGDLYLLLDSAVDPRCAHADPPEPVLICPHRAGFMVLGQLIEAYVLAGDLPAARLAAELRLELPLDDRLRVRAEREFLGLAAADVANGGQRRLVVADVSLYEER